MIGDTPESIEKCLNCSRPHCTNCLAHDHVPEQKPPGKVPKPVLRIGDDIRRFPSIRDAAQESNITRAAIYGAIRDNRRCGGYYWRFEEV